MSKSDKVKNVFISHHSKDDEHISKIKDLLQDKGFTLKNSSIDSTKPNQASDPDYIKSMLRPRINWAGTTIVLIGKETHSREYVNWEIEESNKQGNRIVGVFIRGASDSDVPEELEKYGDALVGWNSDNIIDSIEGKYNGWHKSDGSPWENKYKADRGEC